MSIDPNRKTPRVREGRPQWPRRDEPEAEEYQPEQRRWQREPEPWETPFGVERYPGATVLEDLEHVGDDAPGTIRILARYAVMRVLLLHAAGVLTGAKLRQERRVANDHLAQLPAADWERVALFRLTDQVRDPPSAQLLGTVSLAAEAAAKRGHVMGAFALYNAAYHLGLEGAAWDDAARAARGIGRLARMDEAQYSSRLWERRWAVLERRVKREHAEAQARAEVEVTLLHVAVPTDATRADAADAAHPDEPSSPEAASPADE